ncbi:potassium channel family protein [Pseudonocardia sp.]|uniref:potassium channel family protein n=1 Tax=Pseudonocardia sp. TaxID=60912 RepID=UPI003D0A9F90
MGLDFAPLGGPARRQVVAVMARSLLSTVLMVVVYYRTPLEHRIDAWIVTWFLGGLVALALALAWQVQSILRSRTPKLLAASTIAVGLPFLLLLYSSVYTVMSVDDPGNFSEPLGHTDALYFTMTVFSTIGFGDITPVTEPARIIVMTQMVIGLLAVGVVAKLLFGAAKIAEDRSGAARAGGLATGRATGPATRPATRPATGPQPRPGTTAPGG